MANESTNNAKKEKFIGLLHELFQLNQPELDFGLYRIMHAKSDQIKAFIQNDLASEIDEAFADSGDDKIAELKAAYENELENAKKYNAPDPHAVDAVIDAKEAYDAARDNGDDPSDIYDHLYRFFSRYYDKGDFLSRRYHVGENESRAAPYAVPYDGREVYLHWANKDQYYIKSSEYLSNFSFDLSEAIEKEQKRQGSFGQGGFDFGHTDSGKPTKVTLQLVDAAEGAHNNIKENQSRFFIIHVDKPIDVRPLASTEGEELIINFEYRPDQEKSGQDGGWQKKRLQEAETVILEALKADESVKTFHDALVFQSPTEKDKTRTLLSKYLTSYAARNTMDYFIHKDLGGFLRRELDFYIKNEIMRLDDLSGDDISGVAHSLKKITALRTIARQIIDFLAQLENFQKKLWLKKKFVTEVNYCITLDRVPESFYDEIVTNQKQWDEWKGLGFISDETEQTSKTLKDNPHMVVDTGLMDESSKSCLLAEIEGLDEQCEGVLINSDNFQALKFIKQRYAESVDYIYIDPPYNTNSTPILYKNAYKDSSWISLMADRMRESRDLLTDKGVKTVAIDDTEMVNLSMLMKDTFPDHRLSRVTVVHNPKGSITKAFNRTHEYALFLTKDDGGIHITRTPEQNEKPRKMRRWGENSLRTERRLSFYPIYVKGKEIVRVGDVPDDDYHPEGRNIQLESGEIEIWPIDQDGVERRWNFGLDSIHENLSRVTVLEVDGTLDLFLTHELTVPKTVWSSGDYDAGNYGNTLLIDILGNKRFDFPKSIRLIEKCITLATREDAPEPLILDYFGGSGTTAHASINHSRRGKRTKYCLVEMGKHFDDVVLPRTKKVIYSEDWKAGRPLTRKGISHCFKYLRLESYEDSLNNLGLAETAHTDDFFSDSINGHLRKDFFLNYFLDVETRGSASLLNIEQFQDPTKYSLRVKKPGTDIQVPICVDLIETFNWLLGLEVALLDKPRTYDAEFEREHDSELPEDQHTRLQVKRFKEDDHGSYWFRVVDGHVRREYGNDADKEKVMVIWRKLTDDPEKDAAALEALLSKYRVNQSDSEFDKIYINGPHGLSLTGQAKSKLLSLEETFMARMWEDTDGAMG
ncbi:DNA methyltransferase [Methylophaga sp.]|uniref:DNA methyltransferase n=1 Tax=Methylophaga sp. TaxID=2024840 RepID=UPI003A917167